MFAPSFRSFDGRAIVIETPLLKVTDLKKQYPVKHLFQKTAWVKALGGVSFELLKNRTLAVVGESGCGKSTLARCLMQIESPTSGEIVFRDRPISQIAQSEFRQSLQMIFQDPYGSLNPRKKAWNIIAEPLFINSNLSVSDCKAKAYDLIEKVGLRPELGNRYPHMFSGGQRQRLGIARALILNPDVIICDEPVSALDVSIQAQILNLLLELQRDMGLTYLFISHDLSVVRHISDEVLVIYLGKLVERGTSKDIFVSPKHPYTQSLIAATPSIRSKPVGYTVPKGEIPSPMNPPPGCAFHRRCPIAQPRCSLEEPQLRQIHGQKVACHFAE
jgi:dipeptide transport system ATP-binding protein